MRRLLKIQPDGCREIGHLQAKVRAAGVTEEGEMDGHPGSFFLNFVRQDASVFSPITIVLILHDSVNMYKGLIDSHSITPVQGHIRYSARHTMNPMKKNRILGRCKRKKQITKEHYKAETGAS